MDAPRKKTLNFYNKLSAANFNPVKTSKKRTFGNLGEICVQKIVNKSYF